MPRKKKTPEVHHPRGPLIAGGVVFLLGLLVLGFALGLHAVYAGRIPPGVVMGDVKLAGMGYDDARSAIEKRMNEIVNHGLVFSYQGKTFTVPSTDEDPANPELSVRIFSYDVDATMQTLQEFVERRDAFDSLMASLAGAQMPAIVQVDTQRLAEAIQHEVGQYEQHAVNSQLIVHDDNNTISLTPERYGVAFNYDAIVSDAIKNLVSFVNTPYVLVLEQDTPTIFAADAQRHLEVAKTILKQAPYTIHYEDKMWEITLENVRSWLGFRYAGDPPRLIAGFAEEPLQAFLKAIAQEVNVEKKEVKFEVVDSRVASFQLPTSGLTVDINETSQLVNEKIRQVGIKEIDLIVKRDDPATNAGDTNDLGIRELIGVGQTNFKGSPKNRRHNIAVGANSLNGILIKPGEEFSLLKALGKIEASTGYLPELVIKGNRTIPEYGGGLCQIGTTSFRVALNAGMPIVARRNHSYRVSYYEPPVGMDATIYDPAPDFKFLNDTGHYILFQTEIKADDLIFRFYGTKDGRTAETTTPRVYNAVQPGPTKYIESTDIPVGTQKCVEKAHVGSDAEFTYTVTYSDGHQNVQTFTSHYKPWQAVCLVGVEKLSEDQVN